MSRVYGPDNSNYKDFVPTYEYPILRRQIRRVQEDTNRSLLSGAAAELDRPLRFTFQNPNPLTMIRSARYRLPLKVKFVDQEGFNLTPDEAQEIGFRNRQSKCFSQQRLMLNGMSFYHDSFVDRIEEFTHRYSDKNQQYQLENRGLPICRPRTYAYRTNDSFAHQNDYPFDMGSASEPVVQTITKTSQQTDNTNFTERVKLFQQGWDPATSTWTGSVTFPLQCGPFQPYENRKSGRYPNKYIPFTETMTVESTFDTGRGRSDPSTTNPDHYAVCQNLFEKSGPTSETARFLSNRPPTLELNAYTVAINGTYAWITMPLDVELSGVTNGIAPFHQRRNIKTTAQAAPSVAVRLELCRECYKVGNGIRLHPDIVSYSQLTEPTRQRRAVIAALVEFPSPVGQMVGGLEKNELTHLAFGGTDQNVALHVINPIAQGTDLRPRLNLNMFRRCEVNYAENGATHLGANTIPAGHLQAFANGARELVSNFRRLQLMDVLTLPSVALSLAGMSSTAAEVAVMDADPLRYPKVTYFAEIYNGIAINWTPYYANNGGGGGAQHAGYHAQTLALVDAAGSRPYLTGVANPNIGGAAMMDYVIGFLNKPASVFG